MERRKPNMSLSGCKSSYSHWKFHRFLLHCAVGSTFTLLQL